jgi:hydrogenase maturation protein HypF
VVNLIVEMSLRLRTDTGINTVALSGGVFQNLTLLSPSFRRLEAVGFEVLVHSLVPPNDGGLALGQAVIAAAQSNAPEK